MSIGLLPQYHQGTGTVGVQIPVNDYTTFALTGTVYSGIKFDGDGNIYERTAAGNWSLVGPWRLSGAASTYDLDRTIDSGSLTTDGGTGWLDMSTDRIYDVQQTVNGDKIANLTFSISNDAGSTILANRSILLIAQRSLA